MPTYDYQCRSCGTVTEVIHAMSEDGPTVCDACGGQLRRVLYPAGIIFKGSGFYRTDSRATTTQSSASSSSDSGAAKSSGAETAKGSDGKAVSPASSDAGGSPAAPSSSSSSDD